MERSTPSRLSLPLALALSSSAAGIYPLAPLETVVGMLAALLWLAFCRHRVPLLVAASVLFAVQAHRAQEDLAHTERAVTDARTKVSTKRRCRIDATVTRSPVAYRPRKPQKSPLVSHSLVARVDVHPRRIDCQLNAIKLSGTIRLFDAPTHWRRGDRVVIVADLSARTMRRNPGSDERPRAALDGLVATGRIIDPRRLVRSQSLRGHIDAARSATRQRILATYPGESASYARALVLGESDLSHEDREAFQKSGLAHLLAVSGTHLVVAILSLGRLLNLLLVRIERLACTIDVSRISAGICIVSSWLYADFSGGSGSAWRAAAMLSLMMLTRVLDEKPDASRCFAWSLLGATLHAPLVVHDWSFSLSTLAVAGLGLSMQVPLPRPARVVASTVGATLACSPLLSCLSPRVPVAGIVANLLAAPIGELIALPLSLLHPLSSTWPSLERGLATVAAGALWSVRALAYGASEAFDGLPIPPPTSLHWLALAAGTIGWQTTRKKSRALLICVVLLLLAEVHARQQGSPRNQLHVTVLDVGQGDSLLVDLPNGQLMVVDGGPADLLSGRASTVLRDALRYRRRRRIDILVITHGHVDHYGGLFALDEGIDIGEIWISSREGIPAPELRKWLSQKRLEGVPLRTARELCPLSRIHGGASVSVMHPCLELPKTTSENDRSMVLKISFGQRSAWLMGDAERATETALLAHPSIDRADLLKVGHHGSKTSSSAAWLNRLSPGFAIISCGVSNRFGHPHSNTLRALQRVSTWRTDERGWGRWTTNGLAAWWHPGLAAHWPPSDG